MFARTMAAMPSAVVAVAMPARSRVAMAREVTVAICAAIVAVEGMRRVAVMVRGEAGMMAVVPASRTAGKLPVAIGAVTKVAVTGGMVPVSVTPVMGTRTVETRVSVVSPMV
jgi:hypothetical protein